MRFISLLIFGFSDFEPFLNAGNAKAHAKQKQQPLIHLRRDLRVLGVDPLKRHRAAQECILPHERRPCERQINHADTFQEDAESC
jgi:hypothetical protein